MFKKRKETHTQFEYDLLKRDYERLEKVNRQLSAKLEIAESQKKEYEKLNNDILGLKEKYQEEMDKIEIIRKGYTDALVELQNKTK